MYYVENFGQDKRGRSHSHIPSQASGSPLGTRARHRRAHGELQALFNKTARRLSPPKLVDRLNGKVGVSAAMALALEDLGWGTAEHWMRMQASYELAQARRVRATGERSAGTRSA